MGNKFPCGYFSASQLTAFPFKEVLWKMEIMNHHFHVSLGWTFILACQATAHIRIVFRSSIRTSRNLIKPKNKGMYGNSSQRECSPFCFPGCKAFYWLDVISRAVHPTHRLLWIQKLMGSDALQASNLFMFRNGRVRAIDTHQYPAAYYFLPILAAFQTLTWQVDGVHKEIMSWASFPGKLLIQFTKWALETERESNWVGMLISDFF